MMRRIAVALLTVCVLAGSVQRATADDRPPLPAPGSVIDNAPNSPSVTGRSGNGKTVLEATETVTIPRTHDRPASKPGQGGQPPAPRGVASLVPVCLSTGPANARCDDGTCPSGVEEDEIWWQPYGGKAHPTGAVSCAGAPAPTAPSVSDNALELALKNVKDIAYPVPTLSLNPAPTTLVNLPTILTVDAEQAPHTYHRTVLGTRVTVIATPHFQWSFGDGHVLSTATPGRAYDGTAPADAPGYYLTHTYTRTGTYTVTETTTWSLRAHRGDTGAALTVGDAATTSASTTVTVKQSRARLTGNA